MLLCQERKNRQCAKREKTKIDFTSVRSSLGPDRTTDKNLGRRVYAGMEGATIHKFKYLDIVVPGSEVDSAGMAMFLVVYWCRFLFLRNFQGNGSGRRLGSLDNVESRSEGC